MPTYRVHLLKDDGASPRYVVLSAETRVAAIRAARRHADRAICAYRVATQSRFGEDMRPRTYAFDGNRVVLKRAKPES